MAIRFSQGIGLADEKDIQRWTGKKPGDLRMAVFHSKLDGPDSTSNTYPVSLVGLPLDELAGIRRARIYFGHGTLQNEMHLDKSNQLVKEQGSMLLQVRHRPTHEEQTQGTLDGNSENCVFH